MAEHDVLGGRYELAGTLGRGGMAEVRAARDLRLGRPVAVKLLSAELAGDPLFRTRFRREAQSSAQLNHPGIVAVFDTGEESDPDTGVSRPYIVMERVDGQTLKAVLTGGHQLPQQRALGITADVLDALSTSHAAGIIHRDIKPANVMLTPEGLVKVMDFGIARAVTDTSTDLTQTAAVIGTAQYLSPEQARGETVDLRSDIYSTGCLLYELLVGRPPFRGESAISVVYQHVRETPDPPSAHNPLIHPRVDAITLKALAKDPANRYQSAREMRDDIERVLVGAAPERTAPAVPAAPPPTTMAVPQAAGSLPTVMEPPAVAAVPSVAAPRVVPAPAVRTAHPEEVAPATGVHGPPTRPRRPGVLVLIGALVVLLLGAGGYGLYRTLGPSGGSNPGTATAVVPTGLLGRQVDTVKRRLRQAGFRYVTTKKAADPPAGARRDDVTAISPAEGTSLALDQPVTVTFVAPGDDLSATTTVRSPSSHSSSQGPSSHSTSKATSDPSAGQPTSSATATDPTTTTTDPSTTKTDPTTTDPTTTDPSTSTTTGPTGGPSTGKPTPTQQTEKPHKGAKPPTAKSPETDKSTKTDKPPKSPKTDKSPKTVDSPRTDKAPLSGSPRPSAPTKTGADPKTSG